ALEGVVGGLDLHQNPALATIEAPAIVYVGGPVSVLGNHALRDLALLARTGPLAPSLTVVDNRGLVRLDGPHHALAAGDVTITDNPALVAIAGFDHAAAAGAVVIARNNTLTRLEAFERLVHADAVELRECPLLARVDAFHALETVVADVRDRKSTRLNSSHVKISYAVFCLK